MRLGCPVACQQVPTGGTLRGTLTKDEGQGAAGLARRTAQAQQITRAGAAAQERLTGRHLTEDREGEGQRTAGGVTTDQAQLALLGHLYKACRQAFQPGGLDARQGQRQGEAQRRGAHGGEVAGAHRQGALAEAMGIRAGIGEMHPGGQGIGGDRQLFTRGGCQQRAVVTDAQRHAGSATGARRRGEIATDEFEFTHAGAGDQRLPRNSALRSLGASLSSTPLTNLWPSVAPKILASSMPSLITTR